jgi:hypothetical protein
MRLPLALTRHDGEPYLMMTSAVLGHPISRLWHGIGGGHAIAKFARNNWKKGKYLTTNSTISGTLAASESGVHYGNLRVVEQ